MTLLDNVLAVSMMSQFSRENGSIACQQFPAGGHAKTAIVALLAGIDVAEAAVRLDRVRGRVRDAIGGT